jgi:hypothetical protein
MQGYSRADFRAVLASIAATSSVSTCSTGPTRRPISATRSAPKGLRAARFCVGRTPVWQRFATRVQTFTRRNQMSNTFAHIELSTGDPDKARKFYKAVFDWKFKLKPARARRRRHRGGRRNTHCVKCARRGVAREALLARPIRRSVARRHGNAAVRCGESQAIVDQLITREDAVCGARYDFSQASASSRVAKTCPFIPLCS